MTSYHTIAMPSTPAIDRSVEHLVFASTHSKRYTLIAANSSDPFFDKVSDGAIPPPPDRLDMVIHYCGLDLPFFDPTDFAFPPDVILPNISADFSVSLRQLYGGDGQGWNPADKRNVERLVEQIRDLYREYERKRVEGFYVDKIRFDYDSCKDIEGFDCRISLENSQVPVVIFNVPVQMPKPIKLPTETVTNIHQNLIAYLNVHYYVPPVAEFGFSDSQDVKVMDVDSSVDLPEFWASKRDLLKIPSLDKNTALISYYTELNNVLTTGARSLQAMSDKRHAFFEKMTETFRRNLMECDTDDHSFMAFYFEVNIPEDIVQAIAKESEYVITGKPDLTASAIVQVTLPQSFPKDPPIIQLFSPVNFKSSTAYLSESKKITIPYSPRWEVTKMVMQLRQTMIREIPKFHSQLPDTPKRAITASRSGGTRKEPQFSKK
ncbi:hypothetical protein BC937DRAFT_88564 [Endogone sp. FLAS-F59071]|nr:hypothetical protein BC937DRAFT_88564 [Endogone sp. FLAS-F59071]|eukprot:RUS22533.1 hypothetical protein BC937DRAFT_88564 [Endogone sp. FLAS-F59071]